MTQLTKAERKARDERNRINKLVPGRSRLERLQQIGELMQAEADYLDEKLETADGFEPFARPAEYRRDGLFIARLAHDLFELRRTVRPEKVHSPGRHWNQEWDVRP